MKKWLTYLLCGVLCLSLVACTGNEAKEETTPTDAGEVQENMYVPDKAVNRFLLDFKEASGLSLAGLNGGAYEGEYLLEVNLCEMRLTSTELGVCVTITGGRTPEDLKRMKTVFDAVCRVADKGCSKEQLTAAKAWMDQQTETVGDYRVSNSVKLLSYTPLFKNETVQLDCSVRLLLMNYLPVAE